MPAGHLYDDRALRAKRRIGDVHAQGLEGQGGGGQREGRTGLGDQELEGIAARIEHKLLHPAALPDVLLDAGDDGL